VVMSIRSGSGRRYGVRAGDGRGRQAQETGAGDGRRRRAQETGAGEEAGRPSQKVVSSGSLTSFAGSLTSFAGKSHFVSSWMPSHFCLCTAQCRLQLI
jgi:hypothetical protein